MAIRHEIILSTTDPNNEIGLIKIRQADEETQTLVTQITENATPRSYEGLQVFFCAKLGQSLGLGIIEQKLNDDEMTDPKNGKLEYTMRAEDWQQIGRQVGYFSFRKMTDDHTYVEQFTTRDFNFTVTKNVFSEGLTEVKKNGSTYVWTIEDLLRLFKEYIASGKSDWEEFVEQNREIIEAVDPGGTVLNELISARYGFKNLGLNVNSKLFKVDDIEKIKSLPFKNGDRVTSAGFYKAGDGGGADYIVTSDDLEENGKDVFKLENGNFAKILLYNNTIRPKQIGAIGDGVSDDYDYFTHIIKNYGNVVIDLDENTNYYLGKQLYINNDVKIVGRNNRIFSENGLLIDNYFHRKITCKDFWIENKSGNKTGTAISFLVSSDPFWGATVDLEMIKVKGFDVGIRGKSFYGSRIINCNVDDCRIGYYLDGDDKLISNQNVVEQSMSINCEIGFYINGLVGSSFRSNTCEAVDYGFVIGKNCKDVLIAHTWFEHIANSAVYFATFDNNANLISDKANMSVKIEKSRFFVENGYTEKFINPEKNELFSETFSYNDSVKIPTKKDFITNGISYKNFASTETYMRDNSGGTYTNIYSDSGFGQRRINQGRSLTGGWSLILASKQKWLGLAGKTVLVRFKIKTNKRTQAFVNPRIEPVGATLAEERSSGVDILPDIWMTASFLIKVKAAENLPSGDSSQIYLNLYNHTGTIDFDLTDILMVDVSNVFGKYPPNVNEVKEVAENFPYVFSDQLGYTENMSACYVTDVYMPDYRFLPVGTLLYNKTLKRLCIRLDDYWYDTATGEKIILT